MSAPDRHDGSSIQRREFIWHGLSLHLGRRKTPILALVADETYPHLYRIRYPDGWVSTPANLTRAKVAAYGHARRLLCLERPLEAACAREVHDLEVQQCRAQKQ